MVILLPWAQRVVSVIATASLAYHLLALYEVTHFIRRRRTTPDNVFSPPVTLLKPLVDWNRETRENLASFCRQRYPRYQILVGFPARDAPELGAVNLTTPSPGGTVQGVTCDRRLAVNPKVSELLHLEPLAEHEVLVLCDADMRVGPEYIAHAVAPLRDPEVGVVTFLYCMREAPTLPAAVEALMINVDFAPAVLVARRLFGLKFALGASIGIRRDVLHALGGFEGLADYLADDYQIGHRAWQAGYRVVLSDYVVENRLPAMGFRDLYRHQLRWARTYRLYRPVGWFFSIIGHLSFWVTTWLVFSGFAKMGWRLVGLTLIFRILEGGYLNTRLNGLRGYWKVAWLMPVEDLFSLAMWALSLRGSRVHWAGREFVVTTDGRMQEVEP